MKVRRYFAANMRNALEMVREEQGSDVLILSNRKVKDGIELVTADGEIDEELVKQFAEQAKPAAPRKTLERAVSHQDDAPADAGASPQSLPAETLHNENGASLWSDATTVAAMQHELKSLKSLLERQLGGFAWSDFDGKSPNHARLLRELSRIGIAPGLGRDILKEIPLDAEFDDAWAYALALLASRVAVLDDPILRHGGRISLCGPTGVGKTLVACKLAAQFALDHGEDSVAIVSTDEQRLGARQELKVFGGLLGITVQTASNSAELEAAFERLADKQLVIVDTAGALVDDIRLRELVTQMAAPKIGAKNYLVLGAGTDYQSLDRMLDAAADLAFDGCILTKLDEAASLAPSLCALISAGLPIAYLSAGQRVPDDLETPIAQQLIQRVVTAADDAPAEADPARIERAFMTS